MRMRPADTLPTLLRGTLPSLPCIDANMIGWVALACTLVFGPERIPLDDISHWEIRVQVCTIANEPRVVVDTRTYQRTQRQDGRYVYNQDGGAEEATPSESWWRREKDVRLYLTTEAPTPTP